MTILKDQVLTYYVNWLKRKRMSSGVHNKPERKTTTCSKSVKFHLKICGKLYLVQVKGGPS